MDVRLALTGFGNVGKGLALLLAERSALYERRHGVRLLLTGVADRGGAVINQDGLDPAELLRVKEEWGTVAAASGGSSHLAGAAFLDQAHALVLLEAASTNFEDAEPGWSYVRHALVRGMDIVLASKGALVLHYRELMQDVERRGARLLFSGTVGAPVPVLELAERALVGADILGFEGILNATSNQILTAMGDGASYDEGVRMAQEIGIAETDPTLDVDGWDAAAKAVIVGNAVLGADLRLSDVQRQGIRQVTPEDLEQAQRRGENIRLIASVHREGGAFVARVRPETRPITDTLGKLRNSEMGVVFHTDPLGIVTSTVQQTGGVPTALTVLRDVINLARDRGWASVPTG